MLKTRFESSTGFALNVFRINKKGLETL